VIVARLYEKRKGYGPVIEALSTVVAEKLTQQGADELVLG
jgi:hypothetical protein